MGARAQVSQGHARAISHAHTPHAATHRRAPTAADSPSPGGRDTQTRAATPPPPPGSGCAVARTRTRRTCPPPLSRMRSRPPRQRRWPARSGSVGRARSHARVDRGARLRARPPGGAPPPPSQRRRRYHHTTRAHLWQPGRQHRHPVHHERVPGILGEDVLRLTLHRLRIVGERARVRRQSMGGADLGRAASEGLVMCQGGGVHAQLGESQAVCGAGV